jgi:predicted phosphodiesterase
MGRRLKIALISDIHLEFGSEMPIPLEDRLDLYVFAGDIHTSRTSELKAIDRFESDEGRITPTLYTEGNHSFYQAGIFPTFSGQTLTLDDDHVVIACTLWSKGDPRYAKQMDDFDYIQGYDGDKFVKWTCEEMNVLHDKEKMWLKTAIEEQVLAGKQVTVVTHHLPSFECVHPRYAGDPINSFFASNTLEDIWEYHWENSSLVWLYGHTHEKQDKVHSKLGVRMVSNPHGHHGAQTMWGIPTFKIIEV